MAQFGRSCNHVINAINSQLAQIEAAREWLKCPEPVGTIANDYNTWEKCEDLTQQFNVYRDVTAKFDKGSGHVETAFRPQYGLIAAAKLVLRCPPN